MPSGVAPQIAYTLPDDFGGQDCLQTVDRATVHQLMEGIGGEELIRFVSLEYAAHAQSVFNMLALPPVTVQNVWAIFQAMMPQMYNQ